MHRALGIAGLALALAGCGPTVPEKVHTYNEDALYLFQRGDFAGAGETFQSALALRPEDDGLLYNVGECYDRQGNSAKAEEFYNRCLQRAPSHARCRHALAVLLVKTGRRNQAVYMVEDWLRREPKNANPYAEDGWLWHQAGDLPQAQARLQQALDIDPHSLRAQVELALVYEDLGIPERALALYERVLAQDPRQEDVIKRMNLLQAQKVGRPKP